jgi:nucleotide-binding universal stress UspA family protein
MFRRILIPTDFSTAAEWLFDDAVRIAGTTGAELVILHIRMTWASHPDELRFPADPSLYEYAERQELERLRERVKRVDASLVTRLIVRKAPDPGNEICRTAKDEQADLIVIATHARHHVAHLIVGSTTRVVLGEPPCPVLSIRYGTRKRDAMRRLVVPVHLEQKSHAALDLAYNMAAISSGEVHLVTVCADTDRTRAEEMQRTLAEMAPVMVKPTIVRGNDASKELLRYASKADADAMFLNAKGDPSEGKLDILRHATVPVMIVPGK